MYSTISKIIPAQKITVNLVVFNLVVKMHNGRSRNYYKVGFNFRLEMIRLKLAKFRLNIPIRTSATVAQVSYVSLVRTLFGGNLASRTPLRFQAARQNTWRYLRDPRISYGSVTCSVNLGCARDIFPP